MVARLILLLMAVAVGAYVLTSVLSGGQAINVNERGRVKLPTIVDTIDATGKGHAFEGYCEADAVVLLDQGKVQKIDQRGTKPIEVGEPVIRIGNDPSYGPVYRDSSGKLHEGCAPESQQSYRELPTEP